MDSTTASSRESVCTICAGLLTENPDTAGISSIGPMVVGPYWENEPGPSTRRNEITPSISSTKCGHLFHEECINNVLKVTKVCPNCHENPVTTRSLRRIFLRPAQCVRCNEREEQVNRSHEEKLDLEERLTREAEKVRDRDEEIEQLRKELKDSKNQERTYRDRSDDSYYYERKFRKRASNLRRQVDHLTEKLEREREKLDQMNRKKAKANK